MQARTKKKLQTPKITKQKMTEKGRWRKGENKTTHDMQKKWFRSEKKGISTEQRHKREIRDTWWVEIFVFVGENLHNLENTASYIPAEVIGFSE